MILSCWILYIITIWYTSAGIQFFPRFPTRRILFRVYEQYDNIIIIIIPMYNIQRRENNSTLYRWRWLVGNARVDLFPRDISVINNIIIPNNNYSSRQLERVRRKFLSLTSHKFKMTCTPHDYIPVVPSRLTTVTWNFIMTTFPLKSILLLDVPLFKILKVLFHIRIN